MGACGSKTRNNSVQYYKEESQFSKQNILHFYRFGKIIGTGSFGTVKLSFLLREKSTSPKPYAIKTIEKQQRQSKLFPIQRELDIMKQLDHPNIIRLYETYEDDRQIHFVMEYCEGGELLERLLKNGPLNEIMVSQIMAKLFSACAYMHSKGIAHRDLKPENLLLSSTEINAEIKIIDFGLSKKLRQCGIIQPRKQSRVGSPLYAAPEVLNGIYSLECDNWSLGCIMFLLLCGEPPFFSEQMQELFEQIEKKPVTFALEAWQNITSEAKQLIENLLQKNPAKRMTSAEALNSTWIQKFQKFQKMTLDSMDLSSPPLQTASVKMLRNYANSSRIKKETLKIVLNQLKESDIRKLSIQFKELDQNNNGFIMFYELQKAMKQLGFTETDIEIEEMIRRISGDSNQINDSPALNVQINYSEFLAAMLDEKLYLNKERLWQLFKYYDSQNRNYLGIEDLKETFAKEGSKQFDYILMQAEVCQNKEQLIFSRKLIQIKMGELTLRIFVA